MSFSIAFTVEDDGAVSLTGSSGDVPAGVYTVSGHKFSGTVGQYHYNSLSVSTAWASASGGAAVPITTEGN